MIRTGISCDRGGGAARCGAGGRGCAAGDVAGGGPYGRVVEREAACRGRGYGLASMSGSGASGSEGQAARSAHREWGWTGGEDGGRIRRAEAGGTAKPPTTAAGTSADREGAAGQGRAGNLPHRAQHDAAGAHAPHLRRPWPRVGREEGSRAPADRLGHQDSGTPPTGPAGPDAPRARPRTPDPPPARSPTPDAPTTSRVRPPSAARLRPALGHSPAGRRDRARRTARLAL
ncbi:hypothetical protein EDD90_8602 [Streptomyces sp. Ag109_O5-1]|nr:hypothetical protein EDD90_8602 [Streptomyces sp. Ag109_O5-1]